MSYALIKNSGLGNLAILYRGRLEKLVILWVGGIFDFFPNRKSTKNAIKILRVGGPKKIAIPTKKWKLLKRVVQKVEVRHPHQ